MILIKKRKSNRVNGFGKGGLREAGNFYRVVSEKVYKIDASDKIALYRILG
jgi:hypothetical protein